MKDWNSYGFEVVLVAIVSIAFAISIGVVVIGGHFSTESMTLASSMVAAAGVAAAHIRSTMAASRISQKVDDNTEKTVKSGEKVLQAANGLSDKRAEEAKAAGVAEGKASERAVVLAAVAVAAPEVVPVVAAKLP